jgi:hypothetical protein
MSTDIEAIAKLNDLQDSWKIAEYLRARGIRGQKDNGLECVIARYLKAETDHEYFVVPSWWSDAHLGWDKYREDMPRYVENFILGYDAGRYPFLEESGDE